MNSKIIISSRVAQMKVRTVVLVLALLRSVLVYAGLDLYVYTGIKEAPDTPTDQFGYPLDEGYTRLTPNADFPDQFGRLTDNSYSYSGVHHLRISYSNYNRFRDFLRELVSPARVAQKGSDDLDDNSPKSFYDQAVMLTEAQASVSGITAFGIMQSMHFDYLREMTKLCSHIEHRASKSVSCAVTNNPVQVNTNEQACSNNEYSPFHDLLNFSDCEGVIGPEASRRLYSDFLRYRSLAHAIGTTYFIETYDFFVEALETSENEDVAIAFH